MRYHAGFSLLELMLALSLGAMLCIGVFHIFITTQQLTLRQKALSNAQQEIRFVTEFLRQKIQASGDWSCSKKNPGSKSIPARGFNSDDAYDKLGLTIKSGTDLLQLHECVRMHNHFHYLPVDFFIANTFRVNAKNEEIDALFYKIAHHPREELITDMQDFQLRFGIRDRYGKNIRVYHSPSSSINYKKVGAVKIHYTIGSLNQLGSLYVFIRKK